MTDREELVRDLKEWLGEGGDRFFRWCLSEHGEISPVYAGQSNIPHSVHLQEGMQVRNFLRTTEYCKNHLEDHWLDNNWAILVKEALDYEILSTKL